MSGQPEKKQVTVVKVGSVQCVELGVVHTAVHMCGVGLLPKVAKSNDQTLDFAEHQVVMWNIWDGLIITWEKRFKPV